MVYVTGVLFPFSLSLFSVSTVLPNFVLWIQLSAILTSSNMDCASALALLPVLGNIYTAIFKLQVSFGF